MDALDLPNYALRPAVRGNLLARLGRDEEARAEFRRAATMTRNTRERAIFEARAAGDDPDLEQR